MCGSAACTITLAGPLPPIVQNQTIDGGTFGRIIIDGGGNAGNGGMGGGGGGAGLPFGGGANGTAGLGGALGILSAGNGDVNGNGGGGVAAGPAIFVNAGTLTTTNSGASGSAATGGAAGGGTATAGTANATPVFNFAGTVNGSNTTGPVASALSASMPASLRRR